MRYLLLTIFGFIGLFSTATSWASGQLLGQLSVQITIGTGCVVNGGTVSGSINNFATLNFGSYAALLDDIYGQSTGAGGTLSVNCSNGTPYTIALDNGLNYTTTRRMLGAGPAYISYSLYQDAAFSTPWGTGANALSLTGNGANQPVTVYGLVPAQLTPAAGTYNDTVIMTVAW